MCVCVCVVLMGFEQYSNKTVTMFDNITLIQSVEYTPNVSLGLADTQEALTLHATCRHPTEDVERHIIVWLDQLSIYIVLSFRERQ